MEKFSIGLIIGAIGGALLAANSCKMRTLVKKGQEEVKTRLDEMMNEKIEEWSKENSSKDVETKNDENNSDSTSTENNEETNN